MKTLITKENILQLLDNVKDPEVPVLSVIDLGIIREVLISENDIEIVITPTYSGCPAMDFIATNIKLELVSNGLKNIKVTSKLTPTWTTDWMTDAGKQKLKQYGIAPPQFLFANNNENKKTVQCPICNSLNTKIISQFGSTACKSMYKCLDCLEAFDCFKCI